MLFPFLAFIAVACQEDKPSAPGVTPPTTSAPAADSSTPDTSKVAPPAATGSDIDNSGRHSTAGNRDVRQLPVDRSCFVEVGRLPVRTGWTT